LQFLEKPAEIKPDSHWVNAGILIFETEVFKYIPSNAPSDFGREILPDLLAKGEKIYGYPFGEGEEILWIDRIQDYQKVQNLFSRWITNNP